MRKRIVGLFVLCSVAALGAQDQPAFRTGASYIRVDVFPTAKGAPVTDLTKADFEIFEDKVPQTIASFEHVVVRGRVPDGQMQDPRSVAESRDAVANGRGRIFVVFLDPFHVEATLSTRISRPLTNMLDRALSPDDLVALDRPEFTPADLTFTPKHATVEAAVASMWGQRDIPITDDPTEDLYHACYPSAPGHCAYTDCRENGLQIADDMIRRRRERRTLTSLRDLVDYLGGAREERKAVLVISDGWRLFTRNPDLERPLQDVPPDAALAPGNNPQTGRRTGLSGGMTNTSMAPCERDRRELAEIDDEREAVELEQDANRANVSFYPIDPRGLAASDENLTSNPQIDSRADQQNLTARVQSLRALADSTDGTAIVQTNRLAATMQRVAEDLSSYYLLGYNSSGKMDGKFHAITVRVKRSGVDVRARRGFRALTSTEAVARTAAPPLPGAVAANAAALSSAVASLANLTQDRPLRFQAALAWKADQTITVWASGDVNGDDWKAGGDIDLVLMDSARQTRASARAIVPAGLHSFRLAITPSGPLPDGDYSLVARAHPMSGTSSNESLPVTVALGDNSGVLLTRRGPTTANRDVPTADARFHRTERIGVEFPSSNAIQARLLDRNGNPLPITLTPTSRDDETGTRWQAVNLLLAPFAPGDYVVELTAAGATSAHTLVPFRVVP